MALRAAQAGADVSAQDLAPALIDTARAVAADQGLGAFHLELAQAVCPWSGDSGAATWRLLIESDGPAREGFAKLRPAVRTEFVSRPYLLILRRRRP